MSNAVYREEELPGGKIQILHDSEPRNPREDHDFLLGTMACWSRRYNLGDPPFGKYSGPGSLIESLAGSEDEEDQKKILREYVFLPLYLYDHSGITMSTSPFSDPWDSGMVGMIFTDLTKARGEDPRLLNLSLEDTISKIKERLTLEVEAYDQYLTGDAFGYRVLLEDERGEFEEVDSCWGFYPNRRSSAPFEDIIEEAKSSLSYAVESKRRADTLSYVI